MTELMIDFITSLEGHGAADGWPGLWGLGGPEYLAWLEDQPDADYTILIRAAGLAGRRRGGARAQRRRQRVDAHPRQPHAVPLPSRGESCGSIPGRRLPVITGRTGTDWIYGGYPDVALELVSSRTFDGRLQLLEYIPPVLAEPPGRGP
jgi:hypothetical protein